ncbi:DUF6286 domain-containing protein [Microlunatus parietis]|uniref:DUF6286 domain-containing protein n=1 Tax=Microlunatus parietis TaxID=682979 RepID=A0A7Y9I7U9_9ACTN|nr:DUF6286 domain-containing protein [Microlunatus parietis]NYE71936.1 hypothetical protein [Microlunatus parietis]
MTASRPRLRRRPNRTVPAGMTALGLTALGGLVVFGGAVRLATGAWPAPVDSIFALLAATPWGSAGWLVISAAVALVGLIMIIAAVKPGRLNAARLAVPEQAGGPELEVVISRRGIARLAAARAELVDGVDSVRARADARSVRLSIGTATEHRAELRAAVTDAVRQALTRAGVTPVPRVSATVTTRSN